MILLVAPAHAGLLDTLSDDERQVAICQSAAAPAEDSFDFAKAAGIWEACLAETRRQGQTAATVLVEDRLALVKARAKAAEWRTTDPARYAEAVLPVVARQRSGTWLGTDVQEIFRAWMGTEAGKGRLDAVRTVTVIWDLERDQAEIGRKAGELLRRELEDLGLKWADPGKPEVDTIVYATLELALVEPTSTGPAGSLPKAEARIDSERIRFKNIDDETSGFRVTAADEEADAADAQDGALRAACQRAANRVLQQVLQKVF